MLNAKVPASTANASPGPPSATSSPASAGPATEPTEYDIPRSALACWSRAAETVWGSSPVIAGWKNASAGAVDGGQHDQRPDLRAAGEQEDRADDLHDEPDHVGRDHHAAPLGAIGDDAGDEREDGERDELRGRDQRDVGGVAAHGERGERPDDHRHAVADQAQGLAGEEEPELRLLAEDGGDDHGRETVGVPRPLRGVVIPRRRRAP